MATLKDLATNLFNQGGQRVQQTVNPILQSIQNFQAQNRNAYSSKANQLNARYRVPLKIADPVLGLGQGFIQGQTGFTGLDKKIPLNPNYQPQTPIGKGAQFVGQLAGFATGPGKFLNPLESKVAGTVSKFVPKPIAATAPLVNRAANTLARRGLPTLAAEAASSLPLAAIQSRVENEPFLSSYATNVGMGLAGRGAGEIVNQGGKFALKGVKAGKQAIKETEKQTFENFLNNALKDEQARVSALGIQTRPQKGQFGPKEKLIKAAGSGDILDKNIPMLRVVLSDNRELIVPPSRLLKEPNLIQFVQGPANDAATKAYRQAYSGGFIKPDEFIPSTKATPTRRIQEPNNGSGKYKIIKQEGVVEVDGTPVKIAEGIDTFIHEGTNGWVVSEKTSGQYMASGVTKQEAINKAKQAVNDIGINKVQKIIAEKKLPQPTKPVIDRTQLSGRQLDMTNVQLKEAKTAKNIKPGEFSSKSKVDNPQAKDSLLKVPEPVQPNTQLSSKQLQAQSDTSANPLLNGLGTTLSKSTIKDIKSPSLSSIQQGLTGSSSPQGSTKQAIPAGIQPQVKTKLQGNAPSDNFNTTNLNVSPEVKAALESDFKSIKPQIEKVVGKKLSNQEVLQTADVTSKTLNRAVGRGQTLEWEASLLKARQKLAALSEKGIVDKEYLDTLVTIKSLGTDIGRKLQSFSIGADSKLLTSKQAILEAVLKQTDDADKVLKAAQGVDFNNLNQATTFYRKFIKPSTVEKLDLLRYNSMLSSPNTHINNIASNFQGTGLIAPIEKTITGGLDALKSALTGKPREYAIGEGAAYAKGYYTNIGNAVKNFSDVMSGKSLMQSPDIRDIPMYPNGGAKGKIEGTLKLPLKLLEAGDQFFTALTKGGEEASQVYKKSKGIKIKGLSTEESAAKRLFRSELGENNGSVVLDALDIVANKVQGLKSSKNPIVSTISKFSLPFLKTPTNILKQGVEYSPLGITTLPGSTTKTEQLSKAILGSSIGVGVATLLGSDRLTWAEPTSEKQKQMFRSAGLQPYSVKIGDNWVSYSKLHPAISFNFALVAGIRDALDKKKITDGEAETVLKGLAKWVQFYADQSYLKNIGDIVSSAKGDIESPARLITNYGTQLIPYRALLSWVERIIDPVQRQADKNGSSLDKILQTVASQIPLVANSVPPRINADGAPIPNQNRLLNAFSPARVTTENPTEKFKYNQYQDKLKEDRDIQAVSDQLKQAGTGSSQVGNTVIYIDNGEVKKIKLDQLSPEIKGISVKTKIDSLNKLVELGKIDSTAALTKIQELQPIKLSTVKTPKLKVKKPKKITVKSPKLKAIKLLKFKPIKVKKLKKIKFKKYKPKTIRV